MFCQIWHAESACKSSSQRDSENESNKDCFSFFSGDLKKDLKATLGTGEGLALGLITFAFPSATLEISLSLALGFLGTEDESSSSILEGNLEGYLFFWEKAMIEKNL